MVDSAKQFGGVRAVEYAGTGSGIAAAYAGWLLARMGARVTRLGPPPESSTTPIGLALEVLADGKATQALPASREGFDALLADCDILLCDAPAGLEKILGPVAKLNARFPRLVAGVATSLGTQGPYAGHPATGLDAQALSAVAWSLGEAGREPLTLPPGIAEHQGGAMLAAGCLLALQVRDAEGSGRTVDVSLADVLASYVAGNCRVYIHHGLQWARSGRRASGSGGAYPYVILPCKDGEVCICGRTREEWMRLVQVMGNPEWAAQPRYQDLRNMGKVYPDEVDALMRPWLAQHTMAELEEKALANNLIVSPIRGFAEVLATPQFVERGFLAKGRAGGREVLVPQLPFHATESRREGAPNIAGSLLAIPAAQGAAAAAWTAFGAKHADAGYFDATGKPASGPLAGMRVLDFGWVWSAPWVGTMLAELGAQVIKVEHALRPDNLRLAGRVFKDGKQVEGPNKEMSPMYHQINHGKLGITLNAKDPRAVELAKRLAAVSDLVVENMSPGSMERTHLGYEELRAVNPRIVMLALSSAGQFGALSKMRSYAPTMSSFAGMEALLGYPGEQPIGALNFGLGDPNGSVHALLAALAALRRARATGKGCYLDVSLVEALLGTLRPYLLDTQVHGRQSPPSGNRHPGMAPHGIYPSAGDDAWITLAAADEAQWQALRHLVEADGEAQAWAADPRFQTLEGRLAHVADLDAAIARWTATQPRDALVEKLRAAGIASSPVLSVQEMWRDPHFTARGIRQEVEITHYGPEEVFKAPWRFSDFAPRVERSGPSLGQHNAQVFGGLLGLPAEEIAQLQSEGVIA